MSRFTDPLLFAVLFGLSALTWWIMDWRGVIPEAPDGALAPMTVAIAVVIATPALLFVTVVAFFRAILNVRPRAFWAWVTGASALAALLIWVANMITMAQSLEVGFSTGVWLMAIVSLASLVAFILALTGAIPTQSTTPEAALVEAPAPKPAKAEKTQKAQKTQKAHRLRKGPKASKPSKVAVTSGGLGASDASRTSEPPVAPAAPVVPDTPAAPDAPEVEATASSEHVSGTSDTSNTSDVSDVLRTLDALASEPSYVSDHGSTDYSVDFLSQDAPASTGGDAAAKPWETTPPTASDESEPEQN